MESNNLELDSFRRQWKEEVSAKSSVRQSLYPATTNDPEVSSDSQQSPSICLGTKKPSTKQSNNGKDLTPEFSLLNLDGTKAATKISSVDQHEPRTALEHYEKAVRREIEGNLGDSLAHYRLAFRLDDAVDQTYKTKHFPNANLASRPPGFDPCRLATTSSKTEFQSSIQNTDRKPSRLTDLIESYSDKYIEPISSLDKGSSPLPCPMSELPHEIIVQILIETALLDVATFVGLARVCKCFAYLVFSEDQVWRNVCLESKVGFDHMHYQWSISMFGEPIEHGVSTSETSTLEPDFQSDELPSSESPIAKVKSREAHVTELLIHHLYNNSYLEMFRERPRIRFNGCYISTVNYMRPGQASVSQISWNSPVHIVTYYRYLRFYRDGSVVSLLTTSEPLSVVHHLTKDNVNVHKDGQAPHLPSSVVSNALPGRWRLSSPSTERTTDQSLSHAELYQAEKDVIIETEGVGPKHRYKYQMLFKIKHAGKGKNNKLVWKEYWNYNRLTDDWAQFGLKNDKAYLWSQVRSYGIGV